MVDVLKNTVLLEAGLRPVAVEGNTSARLELE